MQIPYSKIKQSIDLTNGERVVLFFIESASRTIPREELLRNVYKIACDGSPVWRIQLPQFKDARAFLEIRLTTDGRLFAYNADSWEYQVDLASGLVSQDSFLK